MANSLWASSTQLASSRLQALSRHTKWNSRRPIQGWGRWREASLVVITIQAWIRERESNWRKSKARITSSSLCSIRWCHSIQCSTPRCLRKWCQWECSSPCSKWVHMVLAITLRILRLPRCKSRSTSCLKWLTCRAIRWPRCISKWVTRPCLPNLNFHKCRDLSSKDLITQKVSRYTEICTVPDTTRACNQRLLIFTLIKRNTTKRIMSSNSIIYHNTHKKMWTSFTMSLWSRTLKRSRAQREFPYLAVKATRSLRLQASLSLLIKKLESNQEKTR